MIGVLQSILCLLQNIALAIVWAITETINDLIELFGILFGLAIALLPPMPPIPTLDGIDNQLVKALNWAFPVGPVLGIFAAALSIVSIVLVIRTIMKWAKIL